MLITYVTAFWAGIVLVGTLWSFIWLTKELPHAIRLVRSGADSSAGWCFVFWLLNAMILTMITAGAYDIWTAVA